jgi:hypothetical protein
MEKDAHQITTRRTVQLTLGAPGARFGFPLERGSVSVRSIVEGQLRVLNASFLRFSVVTRQSADVSSRDKARQITAMSFNSTTRSCEAKRIHSI